MSQWRYERTPQFVILTHMMCHRHGRLYDYRSTLFFISLSPTLHFTLVDLIFLSYLIYSRDPYLILPKYLHVHSHTLLIFSLKRAGLFYEVTAKEQRSIYSYEGGRSSSANSKATWVPTNSSGST